MVEGAEHRLDGLGGLLSLVKGNTAVLWSMACSQQHSDRVHLREQVVYHVGVDNAVEQVLSNPAKVTVDRAQRTLDLYGSWLLTGL